LTDCRKGKDFAEDKSRCEGIDEKFFLSKEQGRGGKKRDEFCFSHTDGRREVKGKSQSKVEIGLAREKGGRGTVSQGTTKGERIRLVEGKVLFREKRNQKAYHSAAWRGGEKRVAFHHVGGGKCPQKRKECRCSSSVFGIKQYKREKEGAFFARRQKPVSFFGSKKE